LLKKNEACKRSQQQARLMIEFKKGGSLKRSLGMVSVTSTIPKAFGFEDATQ
jgi:hypothetical protein